MNKNIYIDRNSALPEWLMEDFTVDELNSYISLYREYVEEPTSSIYGWEAGERIIEASKKYVESLFNEISIEIDDMYVNDCIRWGEVAVLRLITGTGPAKGQRSKFLCCFSYPLTFPSEKTFVCEIKKAFYSFAEHLRVRYENIPPQIKTAARIISEGVRGLTYQDTASHFFKAPFLLQEDERHFVLQYQRHKNMTPDNLQRDVMEKIIQDGIKAGQHICEAYMYYIYVRIANQVSYLSHYDSLDYLEDLTSECVTSIYDALDTYDFSKKVQLSTWIYPKVYDGIKRYQIHCAPILTLSVPKIVSRYKRCKETFYMEHGRQPTDEELKALFGYTDRKLKDIRGRITSVISLSSNIGQEADDMVELTDMLPGCGDFADEIIEREYQTWIVSEVSRQDLSTNDKAIIETILKEEESLTSRNIAQKTGVSHTYVQNSEKKMRHNLLKNIFFS